MLLAMDVPLDFDPTLLLALNWPARSFRPRGGLAAVYARLDLFGVSVLAVVVGRGGCHP